MATVGLRDYLKQRYGVKDEDIGYNNGVVTLGGRYLTSGTPGADNRITGDSASFDTAYRNLQNTRDAEQYRTQSQNMMGEVKSLLDTAKERYSQPITPFRYDMNSDPAYQSALQSARQNAERESNNITARLRASGQGKSSWSEGVAHQVGQEIVGDVTRNVLPGLIEQAYNRYLNEQNMNRDQTSDLLGLAERYGGLESTAYNRAMGLDEMAEGREIAERQRQEQAAAAQAKAEAEAEQQKYDRLWDVAEQTGVLPAELAAMYGLPENTRTLAAEKIGIDRYTAETGRINANTNRMNAGTSARNADLRGGELELARQREQRLASSVDTGFDSLSANALSTYVNLLQNIEGQDQQAAFIDSLPLSETDRANLYKLLNIPLYGPPVIRGGSSNQSSGVMTDDDILQYLK